MQDNRKNALGRGLSELISETAISFDEADIGGTSVVIFLSLNKVIFNSNQPRKNIDYSEIDDLVVSIKTHGILQPILVRRVDQDLYQVIAGERRCHAARKAGLTSIPAIVKDYNECDALEIAIIENVQRKDLNPIEESDAYCKLVEEHAHTQESLSRRIGKSRSHIANTMRLNKLPIEIKDLLLQNKLSAGHARAIASSESPVELARIIIENNLNVRETEKLIKKLAKQGEKENLQKNNHKKHDADLKELETQLEKTLRMDVQIKSTEHGYKVTINCKDLDNFDLIIAKLNSENIF